MTTTVRSGAAAPVAMVAVDRGRDALAPLRGQWDALAARTQAPFFRSWAWVAAWADCLDADARPVLVSAWDGTGTLRALLPLAWQRRRLHPRVPVPVTYLGLAGAGRGAADRLGPLSDGPAFTRAVLAATREVAGGRPTLLENVDAGVAAVVAAGTGARVVQRTAGPAADLRGGPVDRLWSKGLRAELRRMERRLAEDGICGRWVPPGAGTAAAVRRLADLHRGRWARDGRPGMLDDGRVRFLERLAELATPPAGPWVYELAGDGVVVGSLLCFRSAAAMAYYQSGWDPAWARAGVGRLLVAGAMRRAQQDGLATFDFLRGGEQYKYRFGATDVEDVTLLAGRGPARAGLALRARALRRRSARQERAE